MLYPTHNVYCATLILPCKISIKSALCYNAKKWASDFIKKMKNTKKPL